MIEKKNIYTVYYIQQYKKLRDHSKVMFCFLKMDEKMLVNRPIPSYIYIFKLVIKYTCKHYCCVCNI